MGLARTVYDILRVDKDPAADAALLAALPDSDLGTSQAIVETLLFRGTKGGLRGLVDHFHLLDETQGRLVVESVDRLYSVLREASHSRDEQIRLNVIELIRRGCAYRASYLLEPVLHDRSPQIRKAAVDTLWFMADELLRTAPAFMIHEQTTCPDEIRQRMAVLEEYAEDRRQLVGTIETALSTFDSHLHPRAVEVAMWFVDELNSNFWSMITTPGSRLSQVVIHILNDQNGPRLVPFAMMAMGYAEYRPHLVRLLSQMTDPSLLAEWLRQGWRLAQPRYLKSMVALKELACCNQPARDLMPLPADAQRHLPRWIAGTGLSERAKIDLMRDLLRRSQGEPRRRIVWEIIRNRELQATQLLRQIARDPDRSIADMARWELARRNRSEMPLSQLIRGQQRSGETAAAGTVSVDAPLSFEDYFLRFDTLQPAEQIRLGMASYTTEPLAPAALGAWLRSDVIQDRVRALRIIHLLQLNERFADEIYPLIHDPQPEVRGTAITALGRLPNATARRLIFRGMQDTDTRVQANAVEALEVSGERYTPEDLLPKLSSSDNRVRANAVKALLKLGVREAAVTLLRMLKDNNRAQRISALWLIDKMGLWSLMMHVQEMAGVDPDVVVRQRARNLADTGTTDAKSADTARPAARPAEVGIS